MDALVASLSDPQGFGLHYEWAATGTAAETLGAAPVTVWRCRPP